MAGIVTHSFHRSPRRNTSVKLLVEHLRQDYPGENLDEISHQSAVEPATKERSSNALKP